MLLGNWDFSFNKKEQKNSLANDDKKQNYYRCVLFFIIRWHLKDTESERMQTEEQEQSRDQRTNQATKLNSTVKETAAATHI